MLKIRMTALERSIQSIVGLNQFEDKPSLTPTPKLITQKTRVWNDLIQMIICRQNM